jgi:hypothetical protein
LYPRVPVQSLRIFNGDESEIYQEKISRDVDHRSQSGEMRFEQWFSVNSGKSRHQLEKKTAVKILDIRF